MTGQYKRMENLMLDKISKLQMEVESQEVSIEQLDDDIRNEDSKKSKIKDDYDVQIKELNRRITEMASEFADMLRETLSKL